MRLTRRLFSSRADSAKQVFQHINSLASKSDSTFYLSDGAIAKRQFDRWRALLPRIKPHYAVKCSPDRQLIKILGALGCGFDCASKAEFELVSEVAPAAANQIIFAHPIKRIGDLRAARARGISRMTFDSADELYKIAEHFPEAELVLRILPDGSRSLMNFGSKFGAPMSNVEPLMRLARSLGLKMKGISFHVGSGCFDATAYVDAVRLAKEAFDVGERVGFKLDLLDIGGGFPGALPRTDSLFPVALRENGMSTTPVTLTFEEIASKMGPEIDRLFDDSVEVISEPGRFFAQAWSTLVTKLNGKREVSKSGVAPDPEIPRTFLYYLDDGVYGSFNCKIFDHASFHPYPLSEALAEEMRLAAPQQEEPEFVAVYAEAARAAVPRLARATHTQSNARPTASCTLFGPTCDSMDVIVKDVQLPEMRIGDWLCFSEMGSYTAAAGSAFNGFQLPNVNYVNVDDISTTVQ